jgi:hypothetical protein
MTSIDLAKLAESKKEKAKKTQAKSRLELACIGCMT